MTAAPTAALMREPAPDDLELRRPRAPEPYVTPSPPQYIPSSPPKEPASKSPHWDPRPGYDYFCGPIAAAHPRTVTPKVTATAFCIVFTSVYVFINQLESSKAYQQALGIVARWQMGEYQERHQPETARLAALYSKLVALNDLYRYGMDFPRIAPVRNDSADMSFADDEPTTLQGVVQNRGNGAILTGIADEQVWFPNNRGYGPIGERSVV
ncbi:MAG: hypothetical protein JST22_20715 [Bacteroidetes bacterium]|nr:hypothetical protein [Bacteroidota bacterium]